MRTAKTILTSCFVLGMAAAAVAATPDKAETALKDAYWQEAMERNLDAALKSYQKLVADPATPPRIAAKATLRIGYCHRKLGHAAEAAKAFREVLEKYPNQADAVGEARRALAESSRHQLAELMPPEVLAYAELTDPGRQIERLAAAAGVDLDWLLAATGPLGQGESPAQIFAEIKKARGIAVGITGLDADNEPEGLLVADAGTSIPLMQELRKLANTQGVPMDPIEGMDRVRVDKIVVLLGDHVVIAGRPETLVRQAAARYTGAKGPSLAENSLFRKLEAYRSGSVLFGFADLRAVVQTLRRTAGNTKDFRGLDALVDLGSLEYLYVRLAIDKNNLLAEAGLQLADGHNSILYDLVRTPPLSNEFMQRIPPSAWGVLAAGLGDPQFHLASAAKAAALQHLTGLDLGRELFANIREVGICAMPVTDEVARAAEAVGKSPAVLSFGVIIGAHDAERSKALLARLADFLAKLIQIDHPDLHQAHVRGSAAGVEMLRYQFGNPGPSFCLAVKDGFVYVAADPSILEQMLRAADANAAAQHSHFAKMRQLSGARTSKLLMLNLAPLAQSPVTQRALEMDAGGIMLLSLLGKGVAFATTDETPTQLRVRLLLGGLEQIGAKLPDLIAKQQGQAGRAGQVEPENKTAP